MRIQLPPILRPVMGGERWLTADGSTIAAALIDLAARHRTLSLHLFNEEGSIRHNIVCLHGGQVVRAREAADHRVHDGDEIVLTNALAGG